MKIVQTLLLMVVLCVGTAATAEPGAVKFFRYDNGLAADDKQSLPGAFDSKEGFVWRTALPSGHSTPCIVDDLIFLTTHRDTELATVALYRDSGEVRWKRSIPTVPIEKVHGTGSPATCSPASDGERLYVFFGSYGLLCYDLNGQVLWEKRMGPFQDEFGANSSPILVDDYVIMSQDHDVDSFLIAVNKMNGETVWKTSREGFTRSYSTPTIWKIDGKTWVIVAGATQLAAYDLKSGEKVWWVNGMSRIVSPSPLVTDKLLVACGWTPGGDSDSRIAMEPFPAALKSYDKDKDGKIRKEELPEGPVLTRFFRIDLDQDGGLDGTEWKAHARVFDEAQNQILAMRPPGDATGNLTESHVMWSYRKGLPSVPSPVLYRDVVYMVKNSGIVTTLDVKTGEPIKIGRASGLGNYYASPVAGDGKVYLSSEKGVITILKADGEWEILSYHDFEERIMATPVIDGSRMYVRTDDALYCFES